MPQRIVVKRVMEMPHASDVETYLDAFGVPYYDLEQVNWSDYPYHPDVKFRIAHCGDAIILDYSVAETTVRALADKDNGEVWKDSCLEFFLQLPGDDFYYNIEANCIGTMLIGAGADRDTRRHVADLSEVKRYSSLGREPFGEKVAPFEWHMSLVIPLHVLFEGRHIELSGLLARGNFYKCGDGLAMPHFVSWSEIDLPEPNFHCPDYFGELIFE